MNNQKNSFTKSLKNELGRLLLVSFMTFLFILFFQPFPLEMLDYDDRLLFVTGFGVITFFLASIVLIIIPLSNSQLLEINEWENGPPFFLGLLFLILTTTAFAFYMRYVGNTLLTFYIMFKVVLVCLLPLVILIILYKTKSLEHIIGLLQEQNKVYSEKINKYEKTGEEKNNTEDNIIEIVSDNKFDNLTLKLKNIISVKSADNYIEIYYLNNQLVEKALIRSTLKSIESQLVHQNIFIRCHRTRIVNINYIRKLSRNYGGYHLTLSFIEESVPVSRQYLAQVKEAILSKD